MCNYVYEYDYYEDVSVIIINKNQSGTMKFVCIRENIFFTCVLNYLFQLWTLTAGGVYFVSFSVLVRFERW